MLVTFANLFAFSRSSIAFYLHDATPARVYAMTSPCLFVTCMLCIKMTAWIELIFACRFPSTYATMCFKVIRVPPKIRVVPSGTLSRNFAAACRWLTSEIHSDSGGSAVDSTWRRRLAGVVIVAYSIGPRPLSSDCLSQVV